MKAQLHTSGDLPLEAVPSRTVVTRPETPSPQPVLQSEERITRGISVIKRASDLEAMFTDRLTSGDEQDGLEPQLPSLEALAATISANLAPQILFAGLLTGDTPSDE